jgi:para-nitrobenzyl esterase
MKDKIIQTAYGKLRGVFEKGIYVYRGIPFAAPPIGNKRFLPPEEPASWEGIRDAAEFGSRPIQQESPIGSTQPTSEDCLFLNVWAPKYKGKPLPVMVWVYGGAFIMGSSSDSMYDGRVFAEDGGVIFVSMNYRLGIFGFLHLGEIAGEKYASSGNCGLLDQIAALRWVKKNIAAFGGDPDSITVFGESAGAVSVSSLIVMPEANGLFNKAIIQSTSDPAYRLEKASTVANQVLDLLKITPEEIEKINDVPAQTLLEVSTKIPTSSFWPVIDGVSIPDDPYVLAANGAAKGIPVIIGANKDEYALFAALDMGLMQWETDDYQNSLKKMFKPVWPEMADYFKNEPMGLDLYTRIMTYASFINPTLRYTAALSGHANVWSYLFSYEHPLFKAGHGIDLTFVWKRVGKESTFQIEGKQGKKLADSMFKAWISFAVHGNPSIRELPEWPRFDIDARKTMIFNAKSEIRSDPQTDRMLWDSITAKEDFKDVELEMASDMFASMGGDAAPNSRQTDLPQREGYYSAYDKIGVLLKNKKTEAILYSMEEAFKSPDSKGIKVNKIMMNMMSKMTLDKLARMAGDKFPEELLENINKELMEIKK